jgi:WD40 repeat protein
MVFALTHLPDGSGLLALGHETVGPRAVSGLYVWRPESQAAFAPSALARFTAMTVAPNGLVATARDDRTVYFSNASFAWRHPPFHVPKTATCLAFVSSAIQQTLAIGQGLTIELRRVTDGGLLLVCHGHKGRVDTLSFAPNGRTFLSGAADGTVRLWETVSGKQLAAWHWEIGPINAVAFAPDGLTAACGGDKSRVVVWDMDV